MVADEKCFCIADDVVRCWLEVDDGCKVLGRTYYTYEAAVSLGAVGVRMQRSALGVQWGCKERAAECKK